MVIQSHFFTCSHRCVFNRIIEVQENAALLLDFFLNKKFIFLPINKCQLSITIKHERYIIFLEVYPNFRTYKIAIAYSGCVKRGYGN